MANCRARIITFIPTAFLLAACARTPAPLPTPTQMQAPTLTPIPSINTPIPSPPPPPSPAPIPTPFKSELILCAGPEPETLLDGTPSAELVRRALSALPVTYQSDYTAEPGILASLPSVADGTFVRNADGTVTVTLRYREGLTWSDGEPFSASDAARGMAAPFNDWLPEPTILEANAIDSLTLELVLDQDAGYPYVPDAPPLPSHLLWGDLERLRGSFYAQTFDPGLGPYLLQEWQDGEMVLAANPASYVQPNVPTVRIRFFDNPDEALDDLLAGQCDVLTEGDWSLPDGAHIVAHTVYGPLWANLGFNTYPNTGDRTPYFADVRVRQAIAHALTVSEPENWLPQEHWAAETYIPPKSYYHNFARAVELLTEAGWVDVNHDFIREYTGVGGEDSCGREWAIEEGTPFRVQLLLPEGDPRRTEAMHQILVDLSILGISVEPVTLPPDVFFSNAGPLVTREFDMALYNWAALPEPDGVSQWLGEDIYLHPLDLIPVHQWELPAPLDDSAPPPGLTAQIIAVNNIPSSANDYQGQNFSGWCDPVANIALVNAAQTVEVAQRQSYYAYHLTRFAEQLPSIPLFWYTRSVPAQPYVCGVAPSAANGLTWNLANWYFDQARTCNGAQ